ncbi:hypothetical protein HMPREF1420_01099 [Helicobacter pylori GAM264Ai]|nr:hypothetical protein HMPREF1420_01099 [Helicobacter pylori GAM264Ai]
MSIGGFSLPLHPTKKHSKPKNDRSYQARFFIIPTIKTLSYCKFSLK